VAQVVLGQRMREGELALAHLPAAGAARAAAAHRGSCGGLKPGLAELGGSGAHGIWRPLEFLFASQ
jgi:hypothetical protein